MPSESQREGGPYHFKVTQERISSHCGQFSTRSPATHIPGTAVYGTEWKWAVSPELLDCTPERKEPGHLGLPLPVAISVEQHWALQKPHCTHGSRDRVPKPWPTSPW